MKKTELNVGDIITSKEFIHAFTKTTSKRITSDYKGLPCEVVDMVAVDDNKLNLGNVDEVTYQKEYHFDDGDVVTSKKEHNFDPNRNDESRGNVKFLVTESEKLTIPGDVENNEISMVKRNITVIQLDDREKKTKIQLEFDCDIIDMNNIEYVRTLSVVEKGINMITGLFS